MTTEKIITAPFRVSFPHVFTAASVPGTDSEPKFSVSMLFPKDDKATEKMIRKIETLIESEKAEKWGKKPPKKLRICLVDGDDEETMDETDGASAGYYIIKATSNRKPEVIGTDGGAIGASDFYAGSWARASIVFRAYDKGSNGVACHFQNFMKVRDDEPFGTAGLPAADEFADYLNDDDDEPRRPVKKTAAPVKAKKRPVDDDDDDDDDDDEPRRPVKKTAAPVKAKKRPVDDDDDDDDDDDEPAPRRPAKVPPMKKSVKPSPKRPADYDDDEEVDI